MRKTTFKIPIYGGKITVVECDSLKEVEQIYNLVNTSGCSAISFINPKDENYIMAFEVNHKHGTVAHESMHVVGLIFKDIYAKLDIDNDEPFCYLLGWIVDKVHMFLKT